MEAPPDLAVLRPGWGVLARVLGAVGCAAAIALFVAGGVPLSSVETSANSDRPIDVHPAGALPVDGDRDRYMMEYGRTTP